jgi:hypothetical protein
VPIPSVQLRRLDQSRQNVCQSNSHFDLSIFPDKKSGRVYSLHLVLSELAPLEGPTCSEHCWTSSISERVCRPLSKNTSSSHLYKKRLWPTGLWIPHLNWLLSSGQQMKYISAMNKPFRPGFFTRPWIFARRKDPGRRVSVHDKPSE